MQLTETILIKFLQEGNQKIFESIYEKFFEPLYIYAKEYTMDDNIAFEMVQSSFVKLWEIREKISDDTNIQALMYRITRNNCLNYLKHLEVRKKYQRYSLNQKQELALNFGALNHSSADKIISEELEKKINNVISSLSPKCKRIFILSRYEEKKYREIAEELGLSVKTVENHILKALKILRKHLSEYITSVLLLFIPII